jgi:hypothetical protein
LAGSELFKLYRSSAFKLAADGLRRRNDVRATPGAKCEASDHAILDLGREPDAHSLVFKVADSATWYITAVIRVSEERANGAIVRIRAQATRSGAKSRNFSTAFR